VVEDDADLRERMRRWLAPRYDVALADNGFAAVTELVAHRPHLVILELRLPRIDGYEVLRAIRGRGVPTPVLVASSGLARAADRVRVLVLGANDLLAKPVQKFELLQKVDALVRQAPVAPATYDVEDVEALLSGASSLRVLDTSTFRERVDRACRFGEEYGLPSVLLAIATPSEKQCKRLIDAGPTVLRAEDAVVALPGDRALFLLVSTDTSVVPMILERFTRAVRRAGGSVEGMRWHAEVAVEGGAPGDWDALFGGLADWPEDQEPDRRRARAR